MITGTHCNVDTVEFKPAVIGALFKKKFTAVQMQWSMNGHRPGGTGSEIRGMGDVSPLKHSVEDVALLKFKGKTGKKGKGEKLKKSSKIIP